jgi:outer membrane immunogenic protein
MKTPLAVLVLPMAVFATGAAHAADLPTHKAPPPAAPMAPPPLSWTGFYIGGDIGGAWASDAVSPLKADGGTFPRTNTLSPSGIFGGITAGFNYQLGAAVLGIEGDFGGMGIEESKKDLLGGTEVDHIASGVYGDVTGRAGFLVMDSALVYVKGGFAAFGGEAQTTTGIPGFTIGSTGTFTGWTLGGGLEYKFNPSWSAKIEYSYFDFGAENATLTSGAGVFPYKNDLTVNTVKVGVNYAFQ